MSHLPRRQRVAAYAVILREDTMLLSRLAPRITRDELWTLPGGGIEHGEHPRDAVVREVYEETGLRVDVSEQARIYSAHLPEAWRDGQQVDAHALRIVYDGRVPDDSPIPAVVEVDGSTVEAAWIPVAEVLDGSRPIVGLVRDALADHRPTPRHRMLAQALCRHRGQVLLARSTGTSSGSWTLPGVAVAPGVRPAAALAQRMERSGIGVRVGALLDAGTDTAVTDADPGSPAGIGLVFLVEAAHPDLAGPPDGELAWFEESAIADGQIPVAPVVARTLAAPR